MIESDIAFENPVALCHLVGDNTSAKKAFPDNGRLRKRKTAEGNNESSKNSRSTGKGQHRRPPAEPHVGNSRDQSNGRGARGEDAHPSSRQFNAKSSERCSENSSVGSAKKDNC